MILSTTTELNALLPANVSSGAGRWLTLMEQTERTYIIPLLGKPLYTEVQEEYRKIIHGDAVDASGKAIEVSMLAATTCMDVEEGICPDYTPMQQLIRMLQVPVVYMTLANNSTLLSVSLNDGGMNTVSAEGYDASKKEDREAFSRDCYLNAHKGMEQVLLFLEEDANGEGVFLKKWMESSSFYIQNGLLLRTAIEFNRYVPIAESRETYLQLVPAIRNVQENRIRPSVGDRLLNALIQFAFYGPRQYLDPDISTDIDLSSEDRKDIAAHVSVSTSETQSWDIVVSSMISEEAFDEDLRSYMPFKRYDGMTDTDRRKLRSWTKVLSLVRSALAYYVEAGDRKLKREESQNDAMSNLDRARKLITANAIDFAGLIEGVSDVSSTENSKNENKEIISDQSSCTGHPSGSYIHDPFGTFYG